MDTKIIVSGLLDEQVTAAFPKLNLQVFADFNLLLEYIETIPLRTSKLYITEDITRHNPSSAFQSLVKLIQSVFFKTDEIVFIASNNCDDLKRIEFLTQEGMLPTVNVITGNLQKEFILSILSGESGTACSIKRKEVIRHRRSEFIKDQKYSVINDDELANIEEKRLSSIESQPRIKNFIYSYENNCTIKQITGLNYLSKSIFSVILAQFMSGYGKTLLVDTDIEFFTISYLLQQGKINCITIPLKLFYSDPLEMVKKIKETKENLICITGTSSDKDKNYQVYNMIYALFNLLKKDLSYLVFETDIEKTLPSIDTTVIIENNIISAIQTAYFLSSSIKNLNFAALDNSINTISVKDSDVLSSIISEIINKEVEVPIYKIQNLALERGSLCDLYRYAQRNFK